MNEFTKKGLRTPIMLQRIKPTIILLATLLIGFLLGIGSARFMFFQRLENFQNDNRNRGFIELHHKLLDISPEQEKEVNPILESYFDKLEARRRSIRGIMDSMHGELRPHLSEDQVMRLEEMRDRAKRRNKKRGPGPGGRP